MGFEDINAKLENATEQELAQQTENKIDKVYEIRTKQIALRQAIDKSIAEGREPAEESIQALNESNDVAAELMKDEKVVAGIMEDALLDAQRSEYGNQREKEKNLIKEAVDEAGKFLRQYLEDQSLSDSVTLGSKWDYLFQEATQTPFYGHDGRIHIELIEGKALFKKEILETHLKQIKLKLAEIFDRKFKDLLVQVEVRNSRDSKTEIFDWKAYIANHIFITIVPSKT